MPILGLAQVTPATGDTRPIKEPSALLNAPTICAMVPATKYMAWTTSKNIDPYNYFGCPGGFGSGSLGCSGGRSPEPSLNPPNAASPAVSSNFSAAETTDNAALLSAMNSCPAGQTVELTLGSSGQNAFVFAPIDAKNGSGQGIHILGDMGLTGNASLSPADYGGGNCGTISTSGTTSCGIHWLSASGTGAGGFIGYMNWNMRGWDKFTTGTTSQSWYYQRVLTYYVLHGKVAKNGSPAVPSSLAFTCTAPGLDCRSYGPNGFNFVGGIGPIVYKATLRDSGNFLSQVENATGSATTPSCLFWGDKLFAPFEISNTDGWDPLNTSNCTFTHGYISNGDNHTALKATSATASNITFSDSQTGAGIGVAVGTDITKNVTNFLATGITQNGNLFNPQATGMLISCGSHSGTVNQVTFQNFCTKNEQQTLSVTANGSSCKYSNIYTDNINVLASTAPYTTGNSGTFSFNGLSGAVIGAGVNNFQLQGANQGGKMQYLNVYLGPGKVDASLLSQFSGGTSVTTSGSSGSSTPYSCTNSSWQPLTGELTITNPAGLNNNQTVSSAGPIILKVNVQPTTDINTKESAALTAEVQFYDNGAAIGSPVALSGDNTYASYTVASVPSGTNNYSACYVGDSNYSRFCFGSAIATNGSPSVPVVLTIGGQVVFSGTLPQIQ